ncbi:oligoendopeptidase F [Pirellula staleyi DSM 6068]|uniref:Oligopeptidase F n=1 Tax=Pirellula staleyi (strain ATCC 27377 / DSM 6068 / ICPB 4128) TaxID=530564 RepID=D2R8U6_PIRSD|nr:oligoendopeptidase F [Pirellula staleyi]ADB19396.1 oligoendopeptidase F [Pirellula staleyi DSM 6068]
MNKIVRLPKRSDVKTADTWDLSSLSANDETWEIEFKKMEKMISGFAKFKGKLGDSVKQLVACLKFDEEFDRVAEKVAGYAFLKTTEDQADARYQRMIGRYQSVATKASEAASYIRPEVMALSEETIKKYLAAKEMQPFKLVLERILRYKPHTLNAREEQILAMQGEMAQVASKTFRQLLDADLKFGVVKNEKGEQIELSNSTFSRLLVSPERSVRKNAFHTYYKQFTAHENTLASTLSGSIQKDVYYARVRGYKSSLEAALYPDNVPTSVYDNLIAAVHKNLPAVHEYYDVRRRKMKLRDIHQYDTYVPILSNLEVKRTWKQAVKLVIESLAPLGEQYCSVLEAGLNGRWCDRYPNQGKQSGAFSSGSYEGIPYILMNYNPDVFNDVFTLTHEAGHSMHTWHSAKKQPYTYYSYVIFVAEVASTFNEMLLSHHLMQGAKTDEERAYLVNRELDDIRGTLIRQTMFAEFEKITHGMAEAGEPLTVEALKSTYRKLLEQYFGPEFALDDELSLECLRIPHFYRSFYVYKYATGISAAIALSQRVLKGGKKELADYITFLSGGCSKDPLDLLRDAGVDMEKPEPVDTALAHFSKLVKELDELL